MKRHSAIRKYWIAGMVIAVCLFAGVLVNYVKPMPFTGDPAQLVSDSVVRVDRVGRDIGFSPEKTTDEPIKQVGLIIYPGAKVPPEAYSYLARAAATAGYPAFILAVPLGFAIFDAQAATRITTKHPETARWVVAGHSLGGVAAAMFASRNRTLVGGIAFLASYPAGSTNLASEPWPVSCISASNDMLATPEKIMAAKNRMPAGSNFLEIAGGNHAGFGEYGNQAGDGAAEIPYSVQRAVIIKEVISLLDKAAR